MRIKSYVQSLQGYHETSGIHMSYSLNLLKVVIWGLGFKLKGDYIRDYIWDRGCYGGYQEFGQTAHFWDTHKDFGG